MSKLSPDNKFLDLSDYGRIIAKKFANLLVKTPVTAIHVTLTFFIVGLIACYCILNNLFIVALLLLILKSIIDAADGELARLKKKPSYIGRYLDSNFDFILNFLFLFSVYIITDSSFLLMLTAFFMLQLQGTIYNYYYTILRHNLAGSDTTSRIEENSFPKALHGENQSIVNFLFVVYTIFYGGFDRLVLMIDRPAKNAKNLPNWFMTFVSIYGLGFQLLIMGILLALGLVNIVIPFFIFYTIFAILIIITRKTTITQF